MFKKYVIIVIFILLIISIIACSNIMSDSKNNTAVSGKVIEVKDTSIIIETEDNERYSVSLNNSTKFKAGVSQDFMENNLVTVIYNGVVAESHPMQITAMEITKNEHLISLDPREMVSGIIGEFPMVILDENTTTANLTVNTPFAVSLTFDSETNPWEYKAFPSIKPLEEGPGGNTHTEKLYYWGFTSDETGEQEISFTNKENQRQVIFKITVMKDNE